VDALVACDDGTTCVIDFKTTGPNAALIDLYSRQLHAYSEALEEPAAGPALSVSSLGLLCFTPEQFEVDENGAALAGGLRWIGVDRDRPLFMAFLDTVLKTLEQPEPPPPSTNCAWCDRLARAA
jgi:hypothetical protein